MQRPQTKEEILEHNKKIQKRNRKQKNRNKEMVIQQDWCYTSPLKFQK